MRAAIRVFTFGLLLPFVAALPFENSDGDFSPSLNALHRRSPHNNDATGYKGAAACVRSGFPYQEDGS